MHVPAPRRFASAVVSWFVAGWLIAVSSLCAAEGEKGAYRGFIIDESRIGKIANVEAVRAAIHEQVDIVCAVGLPDEMLHFFRRVPLELAAAAEMAIPSPGLYSAQRRKVVVTSRIAKVGHKPVLLHELLHALHQQQIDGGYGNREIAAFYAAGQRLGVFAVKSHMMKNEKEYFACAGTAYLFGVTAQEPFRRERLKEAQPEFFDFLAKLFGPAAGHHAGSLKRESDAAEAPADEE